MVKNALAPYNTNRSGLWDAIWDSGRRDHLGLNVALLTEQTGRVVYGETTSRQTLTYHLAQGWMQQRTILVPANPKELGDGATAREKIVRMAGSHMYEPHEAQASGTRSTGGSTTSMGRTGFSTRTGSRAGSAISSTAGPPGRPPTGWRPTSTGSAPSAICCWPRGSGSPKSSR